MTFFQGKQPDADWKERVESGDCERTERTMPTRATKKPKKVGKQIPLAAKLLHDSDGRKFIPDESLKLIKKPIVDLPWEPGDIVPIGQGYYMLLAHEGKMWAVAEYHPEHAFDDIPVFTGPSSDDIVAYYDEETQHQVYYRAERSEEA